MTIGEIYSMNGKKDEARKAPRVHRGVPGTMAGPWLSRDADQWLLDGITMDHPKEIINLSLKL